jgi:hypothetical protein
MRATETRDVYGRRFEITPMGAFRGLRVMERLTKVLGPALGEGAISMFSGAVPDRAKFLSGLATGFGELAERLDGKTFEWLVSELAEDTMCQTSEGGMVALKPVVDRYFAGEYLMLFAWAQAAFEVNFGPLLDGLKRLVDAQPAASDEPAK